ncbi:MerR family transcriptional regulator [Solidesulfovibrio carbinolicus]|uniref:MerR family transcriptional regulator n=1 Tax=Solidesulfovibrio carbinolicus TaxID=296842 RepID=A0A4P6HRD8_9BACT|nr:MerR family transcriptional regulator [Solidesulfovibrio carbinolicus]
MADNRLYSIATMAKILDMPESTLHYWKNRFDDVLPSFGTGRGKRYRAEAVAIFRDIGALLAQGLSAGDVRSELARRYPVNVGSGEAKGPAAPQTMTVGGGTGGGVDAQTMLAMASAIGAEIARTLAEQLGRGLSGGPAALPETTAAAIQGELAEARAENAALADKMRVLESELVRLRKDRRELENHLLGKIKALGEERGNG